MFPKYGHCFFPSWETGSASSYLKAFNPLGLKLCIPGCDVRMTTEALSYLGYAEIALVINTCCGCCCVMKVVLLHHLISAGSCPPQHSRSHGLP